MKIMPESEYCSVCKKITIHDVEMHEDYELHKCTVCNNEFNAPIEEEFTPKLEELSEDESDE